MVAVPAATAVTLPLSSTAATVVLLELQLTFLLVALVGATEAVSVSLSPSTKASVVLLIETPVTATVLGVGGGVGFGSPLGLESPPPHDVSAINRQKK